MGVKGLVENLATPIDGTFKKTPRLVPRSSRRDAASISRDYLADCAWRLGPRFIQLTWSFSWVMEN